ncbi:t-SNARE complex subunit (syntaxin) [Sphingomonas naasensis]|uniref:hypothetical protein n=1 Tax=Sphingomonas naasensis TaxID=1344951 RepID=UPI00141B6B05|nr:hypothetical protein [Sphingomonas naasensis]NIJ20065.1 t-SNARE complex subunit (syntaxin) [Sphingomonas naasensis]
MVDGIGELVVEAVGTAIEVATDSRSRRVRRVAWGVLIAIVVLIVAVLIMAFME